MNDEIHIRFPKLGGAQEQGPNDSGLEHFMGDLEKYIARECVQNSIDACADHSHPVRVEFDMKEIVQLPGLTQLRDEIIPACKEYFSNDEKASEYCNKALDTLKAESIRTLVVSDFNTKGLSGGDEDRDGRWYALVRSSGVTNKDDTGSAGSFGIGKNAPFAASALRTTFYVTVTADGAAALQGVSKWWSHLNNSGKQTHGTGFIGFYNEEDEKFCSVRQAEKIPDIFKRSETGSDIWIPGILFEDSWEEKLTESILENFWMAIHGGILEVKINGAEITKENLEQQLNRFTNNTSFQAYSFYLAKQLSEKRTMKFPFIGEVELYLLSDDWEGDVPLPKKVAGMRKTGMTIETKRFHCRRRYAGVLLCRNDEGNRFLRSIEPPRHDKWDKDRIKARGAKAALDSMWEWVKQQVQELNPKPKDEAADVPGLADFLPDIPSRDKDAPDADADIRPRTVSGEISTTAAAPEQPDGSGPRGGDEEDDTGRRGEETTGEGGSGGGTGSTLPGTQKIFPLKTRSMQLPNGEYRIIIHSEHSATGDIVLLSSADDGTTERLMRIEGVSLEAGKTFRQQVSLPLHVPIALFSQFVVGDEQA